MHITNRCLKHFGENNIKPTQGIQVLLEVAKLYNSFKLLRKKRKLSNGKISL